MSSLLAGLLGRELCFIALVYRKGKNRRGENINSHSAIIHAFACSFQSLCERVLCLTTCSQWTACSVAVWPFVICMRNEVRGGLGQRSDKVVNLLFCCKCHTSQPFFDSYCEQLHRETQETVSIDFVLLKYYCVVVARNFLLQNITNIRASCLKMVLSLYSLSSTF